MMVLSMVTVGAFAGPVAGESGTVQSGPAEGPLTVTATPGEPNQENTVAFAFNASTISDERDILEIRLNFSEASGVNTTEISEDQVTIEGQDTGTPSVDSTSSEAPGVLLVTSSDTFTLANEDGMLWVNVTGVTVPNSGTFDAKSEYLDDQSSDVVAFGTDQYTIGGSQDPASFEVSIDSTNSPVTAGNSLEVTADVQNTGDQSGQQTISLDAGALGQDSQTVSVDSGNTKSVTLSVGTNSGDAGEYTATVSSANDSASTDVTVNEQPEANFDVSVGSTNSPVTAGNSLEVTADIQNTGGAGGEQTVTLDAGPLGQDSTTVSLDSGDTTSVTLSVGTNSGDAGEYTATVSSANDSASTDVTVNEQPEANFDVSVGSTNSPVTAGNSLEVTADIQNTGGAGGEQTVTLDAGPLGQDSTTVSVDGGDSTSVTLSVGTSSGDTGEYTATVSSADDSASTDVTVEPETFDAPLTVDVTPGESRAENEVTFSFNASQITDERSIEDIVLEFDAASGVDTTAIAEDDVTIRGQTTGSPSVDATTQEAPGQLRVVSSDTFTLAGENGLLNVTVTGVIVSETGTFDAGVEMRDSEEDALVATGSAQYEITEGEPAPIEGEEPPQDADGDGLYEDVDGDGNVSVSDVQVLFENRDSDAVQANADLFDFAGGDGELTLEDIRQLYAQILDS